MPRCAKVHQFRVQLSKWIEEISHFRSWSSPNSGGGWLDRPSAALYAAAGRVLGEEDPLGVKTGMEGECATSSKRRGNLLLSAERGAVVEGGRFYV